MRAEKWLLTALTSVLALRLFAAAMLIPTWQGPDEPQHVYLISLIVGGYGPGVATETATVGSMYRHGWWEHFQQRRPPVVPQTFADGPSQVTDVKGAPGGPIFFHRGVAFLFRWFGVNDIERQYSYLRLAGAGLGLLTFWIVWIANRLVLDPETVIVAGAVVALHPQFLLVSLSANPDGAVLVLGALIWLSAALVIARRGLFLPVAIAWLSALIGVAIRRLSFPLLVDAAVVTGVALWVASPAQRRVLVASTACGSALLLAGVASSEATRDALSWSTAAFQPSEAVTALVEAPYGAARLAIGLFKSFWLTAGWMQYAAPSWWYGCVAVLVIASLVGLLRAGPRFTSATKLTLTVAAVFAVIQLLAIFIAYIPIRAGVQGRYLMPVIGPIVALIAAGLVPPMTRRAPALAGLVTVLAGIDVVAWGTVLLPAYWSPM